MMKSTVILARFENKLSLLCVRHSDSDTDQSLYELALTIC